MKAGAGAQIRVSFFYLFVFTSGRVIYRGIYLQKERWGMELSAQKICNWFETNMEKTVLIQKEEQTDLDRIELDVQEVGILDQSKSQDAYIPNQAVVLRGVGTIQNQNGEKQRLPGDYYEIPLEGSIQGAKKTNGLEIHTQRAHYLIDLKINN
jgi:hypothetical protein